MTTEDEYYRLLGENLRGGQSRVPVLSVAGLQNRGASTGLFEELSGRNRDENWGVKTILSCLLICCGFSNTVNALLESDFPW